MTILYNIILILILPKKSPPDPKNFASSSSGRGGRGERRPAHTPTHINIKQNLNNSRSAACNTRHRPRKLQPGERHTHHRCGRRGSGGQPAAQQKRSGSSLLSSIPSTSTSTLTLILFCVLPRPPQQINNELSDLIDPPGSGSAPPYGTS